MATSVRMAAAAVVGGFVMFVCGAVLHVGLELETRTIGVSSSESQLRQLLANQSHSPGFYAFPSLPPELETAPKAVAAYELEWMKGPSGILLVAPTGEASMGPVQLLGELFCNIAACALACLLLISQGNASFVRRCFGFLLLAPVSTLTLTASHVLWYRFPHQFAIDGLWVALVEWSLAGLVMAWILRGRCRVSGDSATLPLS
ncbi:MAG TPA: hypothetical protein DCR20_04565 [Planctomycetaceae bacterium]|nr:hypothetical protein [Planctomycetaceae bacterium]